ncbi:uncharacterized protein LOC124948044 [Vespa velutina]|uniref:uncharacterized protein LOC124948044 n=1 Tax=Vespa velutina TaxID=202808 RepID=UPI001FB36513|nr:uncharacterized protein LOC124948044 [Vespa velutina]
MLSVVDSTKFILTLQSSPPFIVESIFVLAFVILLAVPLFANLIFYLGKSRNENGSNGRWNKRDPRRRIATAGSPSGGSNIKEYHHETGRASIRSSEERIRRAVVMHYPAPIPTIDSSSSSDYDLEFNVDSNRRTVSTPNLCSNSIGDRGSRYKLNKDDVGQCDQNKFTDTLIKRNNEIKDVPVERSSSFVVTNSELPIIDISTFNYNAYRHKLIEASLKKRYKNHQPPGDVIFNSIHLNTSDSMLGIRLNDNYDHSFFDFIEEYYDATSGMSKKEVEFLHPLDHFLVKGIRKRETNEIGTDTMNLYYSKETDRDREIVDNSYVECKRNNTKSKNKNFSNQSNDKKDSRMASNKAEPKESTYGSIDSRKDSEWLRKGRHIGAGGLVDSNSIRRKLRRSSNVDQVQTRKYIGSKTSNDIVKPLHRKLATSIVKTDRDSIINVSTASSSELDSNRDVTSNYSRDSSVPSSRDRKTTRKLLPWINGNPSVSFNRKYGNNRPEKKKTFEKSKRAKLRTTVERSSTFGSRPYSPRPRSANLTLTEKGKTIEDRTKSERIDGLNAIKNYDCLEGIGSLRSNSKENEISSFNSIRPMIPSKNFEPSTNISSRFLVPKFHGTFENDDGKSRGSLCENVVGISSLKFQHEERDNRRSRQESKNMTDNNFDLINSINDNKEIFENYGERSANSKCDGSFEKTIGECRTTTKVLRERFVNSIDDENESTKNIRNLQSILTPRKNNNEISMLNKVGLNISIRKKNTPKKVITEMKNVDKTHEIFTNGNRSLIKMDTCPRSAVVSRDTLILDKNDSRTQKSSNINCRDEMTLEKERPIRRRLSRADSKVGLAVQTGLKNYIKKLKQLLKNDGNIDTVDLASLSLKDAISPELESILSVSELKELQDLLNVTEIKSNLIDQNVI